MFFQREYLREAVSMTLNETYRVDLPEHGILNAMLFRISGGQASGYGQDGGDWRIIDKISKIEIILNGATICKSFTGIMAHAVSFYDQGVPAPDTWRNYATNTQWCYILVNFGRWLYDTEYGLDLSKFDNVELTITNTATSSHFSDLTISVLLFYLREPVVATMAGYLRTEEWRSWTTVANATEYLDLPTEHILRRIILQAIPNVDGNNIEKTGMHNLMEDIALNLDTGVIRVYKGGLDDLMRSNLWEYGKPIITGGFPYLNPDKGYDIGLGYTLFGAAGAGSQDGAGASTVPTIESGRTSFTQKAETFEGDHPMCAIFSGVAYCGTAVFRFDYLPDPTTWLDPAARKTVQLNIKTRNLSDAADGTNKVILDRLVKY